MANEAAFPFIDERVKAVGTSYLRKMNAGELESLNDSLILIQDSGDKPLAVMVAYDMWLEIQEKMRKRDGE